MFILFATEPFNGSEVCHAVLISCGNSKNTLFNLWKAVCKESLIWYLSKILSRPWFVSNKCFSDSFFRIFFNESYSVFFQFIEYGIIELGKSWDSDAS